MRDVHFFLALPWTIQREEHDDDGRYIVLKVAELPGFVVASDNEAELEEMFWPALRAFLNSYLQRGETPPLPRAARLARVATRRAPRRVWAVTVGRTGRPQVEHPKNVSTSGYVENFPGTPMPAGA